MQKLRNMIDRVRAAYWNWRFARMEHVTPESIGLPSVIAPPRSKRALVVGAQRGGAVAAAVAAMTRPKEPPLRAYKDGALMRGRRGEVYELSNVDPATVTGSVGATLRRLDKHRNDGRSGRQKKRQRTAQRRALKRTQERNRLMEHYDQERVPEADDQAEARRLVGCE